jgi:hypothetical protein
MTLMAAPAPALPEGRVYEQVSPFYKGGYGIVSLAVAPDGESMAFESLGVFGPGVHWAAAADSYKYVARRGALGWSI